jgi:hypothetical protein
MRTTSAINTSHAGRLLTIQRLTVQELTGG